MKNELRDAQNDMNNSNVLGLIAGAGRLPFLVANGAKKAGLKVICVSLGDMAERSLADEVHNVKRIKIARINEQINIF